MSTGRPMLGFSRPTEQLPPISISPPKLKEFCDEDGIGGPAAPMPCCLGGGWWLWLSIRRSGMLSMLSEGPCWGGSWLVEEGCEV